MKANFPYLFICLFIFSIGAHAQCVTYDVHACIDVKDDLHVQGNQMWWVHHGGSNPGEHSSCSGDVLSVNGDPWGNWSNHYTLNGVTSCMTLTTTVTQCSNDCNLIQAPSSSNNWETIYEFDDSGPAAAHNYKIKFQYCPTGPTVTSTSSTICSGQSATVSASGASSYHWSTGANSSQITVSPTTTTSYTVTGTTNGCSSTDISTVTVRSLPNVNVNSQTICSGTSATLTASGAGSYSWSTGSTANHINVSPTSTTSYTVTGTNSNNCSATDVATVTVRPSPTNTVAPITICVGDSATLTETGGPTFLWSTGATTNSITVAPTTTAPYTVTETASNGCSASSTVTVTVTPIPIVLVNDTTICDGQAALLVATGATTYLWSNGGTTNTILVSPSTTTSYTVTGSTAINCSSSASANVTVNPSPIVNVNSSTICSGNSTQLIASGAINYLWNTGDTTSSIIISPTNNNNYAVIGYNQFTCSDTAVSSVTVNQTPVVMANSATICAGETAILSASGATSYTWSNGANTDSISIVPTTNTYYVVIGTSLGCSDTAVALVTVNPVPIANFNTQNICLGDSVLFTNLSGISSGTMHYLWTFGDLSSSIATSPNPHIYQTPGTYHTQLTAISDNGCIDSINKVVIVNPNPVVDFSVSDTIGCEPLCVILQSSSTISTGSIASWIWNSGNEISNQNSSEIDYCYSNDSVFSPVYYSPSLTVISDSSCSSTISKNNYIKIFPKPAALFTADPLNTTIANPEITITDFSIGANSWHWNFGNTVTSTESNPSAYIYSDTGKYLITLITSTLFGCLDTAYNQVIISSDFAFYVPNSFTPDSDGLNDTFIGQGTFISEFEMNIFDRWGNLIYHTTDLEKPWDGHCKSSNDIVLRDVYVYKIKIMDFTMKKHEYQGTVTLVR